MVKADVRFVLPAPALRPFVTAYYTVEIEAPEGAPVEDRTHPEWANIRFEIRGSWQVARLEEPLQATTSDATLFGPTSQALRVRSAGPALMQGVGLTGLGWARLIGGPAHALADGWEPLSARFGEAAARLVAGLRSAGEDDRARAARLDEALLARSEATAPTVSAAGAMQALLLDPSVATVEGLAERLSLSARQVERVSREHFGFPPKRLLNRARFMRTMSAVRAQPGRPWRELIDEGYFDHSHFVRDFRRFMGLPATRYFAAQRAILAPAADAREKALGGAYQALHPAGESATD